MTPLPKTRRKSGQSNNRQRLARKLRRDRKIYRSLRALKWQSENRHRLLREEIEPLSVYGGKPELPNGHLLTRFPITHQWDSALPMPQWSDLTPWLKTQLLVMACNQWLLQTFSVTIAMELEADWVARGADARKEMRERVRKHLGRVITDRRTEHFFVMEGWSKRAKAPTRLHIHGAAFVDSEEEGHMVVEAMGKAGGQGLYGRKPEPRAVHGKMYWREGPRYVDYLFKSVKRPDQRLERRRLTMSREATGAAREFWGLLTEPR